MPLYRLYLYYGFMKIDRAHIIQLLSRSRRPKSGREIAAAFGASSRQKKEIYQLLHEMVRQGELKGMRGGKFVLPKLKKTVEGELRLLRNGAGIVTSKEGYEIRVPERALYGAMRGDVVEVSVDGSRGNRPDGRVIRVVKRLKNDLVGLYQQQEGKEFVVPVSGETASLIQITGNRPDGLEPNQIVVVQLTEISTESRALSGSIVEIIGDADEPGVDMRVIARRFGISTSFPPPVLALAQQVSQSVTAEERLGRRDLRHLPFVTIDGETAKDFDDAVTLTLEPSGHYRLFVAIADVAHYVPDQSLIDEEANLRGTSVYLPGICIPMLPETLSNGICSLNPEVDRLVMTVELLFDQNATVIEASFSEAVICSHARLTYTAVQQFLDAPTRAAVLAPYQSQLSVMRDLALKLTHQRLRRGALDLEIPESEILLDSTGCPESIVRVERTIAHRLIEEFMLAANEAVAASLTSEGFPLIYRIHEPPAEQDMEAFFTAAKGFGAGVVQKDDALIHKLQKILDVVTDKAERGILSRLLLRSLKQAMYHPENRGHFGLASEFYCHFTSPIRRYPDLTVHRMLKQKLARAVGETVALRMKKSFLSIAENASKTERRAIDAERDARAMKTCQYMLKHVGEVHDGHISSVHSFGFFVEIDSLFVEGLVHISSLKDTYYRFDEENKRLLGEGTHTVYATGSPVRVVVREVNVQRREIDYSIEKMTKVAARHSYKKPRKWKR